MIIAVESEENVAEMFQVLRNAAIEGGEEFHRNQENVDHHGISNDDAKLVNGLAAGVEAGHFAQNQAKENQKRGSGGKRRGQEDRKSTRLNSSHLGISYAV